MENLEGKYFENVIAALKKAREQQEFVVRSDFKSSLRAEMQARAFSMSKQERDVDNWADWILRNKFVFGGVPVLAAVALVAVNSMNWGNIQIPMDQIAPDSMVSVYQADSVNENSSGDDVSVIHEDQVSDVNVITKTDVQEKNGSKIVTFSAELVMPPAEVLANRFVYVSLETEVSKNAIQEDISTQKANESSNVTYTFMENVSDSVKIVSPDFVSNSYYPWSSSESFSAPVRVFSEVFQMNSYTEESLSFVENEHSGELGGSLNNEESGEIRSENSGQIDFSMPTESEIIVSDELPPVEQTTLPETEAVEVVDDSSDPLPQSESSDAPENLNDTQSVLIDNQEVLSTDVLNDDVGLIPVVNLDQATFVNRVEGVESVLPSIPLPAEIAAIVVQSVEVGDRIVYEGENRSMIVGAVLEELVTFEQKLSDDHYVVVELMRGGSYKATLFEKGQVSRAWIITETKGEYHVVTEIVF
jgi:hypothetical protein